MQHQNLPVLDEKYIFLRFINNLIRKHFLYTIYSPDVFTQAPTLRQQDHISDYVHSTIPLTVQYMWHVNCQFPLEMAWHSVRLG